MMDPATVVDLLERGVPLPFPPAVDRSLRRFRTVDEVETSLGVQLSPEARLQLPPLLVQPRLEQGSELWHFCRAMGITASDLAAAIGVNPYQSIRQLIDKKSRGRDYLFEGNANTQHGTNYENCALHLYEERTGNRTLDFGLLMHHDHFRVPAAPGIDATDQQRYDYFKDIHVTGGAGTAPTWLKGSPDGVVVERGTGELLLLEIKCPVSSTRFFPGQVLSYYYPQVQLNMFLTGIRRCHFVQYLPRSSWFQVDRLDVHEIPYDDVWMQRAIASACITWEIIQQQRVPEQAPKHGLHSSDFCDLYARHGVLDAKSLKKPASETVPRSADKDVTWAATHHPPWPS